MSSDGAYSPIPARAGRPPAEIADLAQSVIDVAGPGRLLVVGEADDALVRAFVSRGVAARGISAEEAIRGGDAADTVVAVDVFDTLPIASAGALVAALIARTGRTLVVRVGPERTGVANPASHARPGVWWQERFVRGGLGIHPRAHLACSFASLLQPGRHLLAFERGPAGGVLGEAGCDAKALGELAVRREVAVIAAGFARPMDRVGVIGDAGSGRILDQASAAGSVLVSATAGALAELGNAGLNMIVATAISASDVAALLREAGDRLTPGGRLVLGLDGSAWSGVGPTLSASGLMLPERCFALRGGSGGRPAADEIGFSESGTSADIVVAVLMRDPLAPTRWAYEQAWSPDYAEVPVHNVAAFGRDMANPWLFSAIVDTGHRCSSPSLLDTLCRRVIAAHGVGTPDHGAAVCVRSYRALESGDPTLGEEMLRQATAHAAAPVSSPHGWRWKVSCAFVAARLLEMLGRHTEAERAYLACDTDEYAHFSPLLASKPIEALWRGGRLMALRGELGGARRAWVRGLERCREALRGDWVNIWGEASRPLPWGVHDGAILMDLASRCSSGLTELSRWERAPAQALAGSSRQSFADSRAWIQRLTRDAAWLKEQAEAWEKTAHGLRSELETMRTHVLQREDAVEYLRSQVAAWQDEAEKRDTMIGELRAWANELQAGRDWLASHAAALESRVREFEAWTKSLEQSKQWLSTHAETLEDEVRRRTKTAEELAAWSEELRSSLAYAEDQRLAWERTAQDRERCIRELSGWVGELEQARDWLESQWKLWAERATNGAHTPGEDGVGRAVDEAPEGGRAS